MQVEHEKKSNAIINCVCMDLSNNSKKYILFNTVMFYVSLSLMHENGQMSVVGQILYVCLSQTRSCSWISYVNKYHTHLRMEEKQELPTKWKDNS